MSTEIFTAGYTGMTPADLLAFATELDATLVDIRYNAWSRAPQWRQGALRALVGADKPGAIDRYRLIPELGNENYKPDGPIKLHRPKGGVALLRAVSGSMILLCACREWETCHRRQAADLVATALGDGARVVHLPQRYAPDWRDGLYETASGTLAPMAGWKSKEGVQA